MRIFKDKSGETWEVSMTVGAAKRLRDRCGIDIMAPEKTGPDGLPGLTSLGVDEFRQAEAIACMLEPQFLARGMDSDQVLDLFDGAALAAAQTAFWEELENFFRSQGHPARAAMVMKQRQALSLAVRLAAERVEAVDVGTAVAGAMSTSSPGGSV